MATARAIASGNWSATGTWNGGVLPGNGDTVYANGFTVTIDQNVNIGGANNPTVNAGSFVSGQWYEITTAGTTSFTGIGAAANTVGTIFQASGVGSGTGQARARATLTTATNTAAGATTGGGGFTMSVSYNMTCDLRAGTTVCLTFSGSASTTLDSVIVSAGSLAIAHAVLNNGTGTINAKNLLNTISGNPATVLYNNSTGTVYVENCIIANHLAIQNLSNLGTISFVNCSINGGGTGTQAIQSSGILNINNCTINGSGGSVNSTPVMLASASSNCIINNSTLTANVSICVNAAGGLSITASTITASSSSASITATGTTRISGIIVNASNGQQAINSTRWILNTAPTNAYIQHALDGINANSFVRFFTADNSTALNQAAPTDVRSGVAYGIGNSQTGRLTVPARGSVALSVNYGPSMQFTATRSGTTATATLAYSYPLVVGDQITVTGASNAEWNSTYTIASVVNDTSVTFVVPATHSATAGTGATMQTTGTAVLDPAAVASAVWGAATRTITGGLVDTATTLTNAPAVPSVVQIRQEMDSNSTKLANLDTTVSSRLAPNGTLATVTTLTNAPTVPTPAQIASQVRTELSVELGRVDVAVSSRATAANIPTTDIAAIKAKTDALNVDRVNNTATTAIVGNLLAQANS